MGDARSPAVDMIAAEHAGWRCHWADFFSRLRRNRGRVNLLSTDAVAALLVCAGVFLNFALAFINANVMAVDRGHVILGEVLIVSIALVVCVVSNNRLMNPWFGTIWILLTIFLLLSMARQTYELKHLRDVMLIPVFVLLGIAFVKGNIVRLFCALQGLILGVMLFEAVAPQLFADLVKPWDYYVHTRLLAGLKDRESWHPESGLYISAFRPGGRILFESLGIHRLSSVFLEPVSLGNWCIIVTIFATAFRRLLSTRALVFLVISNILLIIGSDGRLALTASVIIVLLSAVAHQLPKYIYLVYLPAAVLVTIGLATVFDFDPTADDFPGRIAHTAEILKAMDLVSILGLDLARLKGTADSGIGYLILTQSIVGVVVLWVAICLLQPPNSHEATLLMHGICTYISLLLMVSFSLFSIKVAAPLWFLYGFARARGFLDNRLNRPLAAHSTSLA